MCEVIFLKLDGIKNLTLLDSETATEFRFYPEFNKIFKICDQYSAKYETTLKYGKTHNSTTNIDSIINT